MTGPDVVFLAVIVPILAAVFVLDHWSKRR